MRKNLIIAPLVASAALLVLGAGPAMADPTDATFTITGGALAITAPVGTVALGTIAASAGTQNVGAALGNVTVTDGRGGVAGWVASVISTAFTPAAPAVAVTASAVDYTTPAATVTGTSTVTAQNANGPIGVMPVQTATTVSGANSATWNPTITVHVPAGAMPGVYAATLTHSVV
jgi:hypothetical protein